ncbi:uncharacterized protein LODBEIA_P59700 [Lodderomyces beijingensis]|uniref:Tubulin binding cofactor C-like domain-containing protein n=1 Tax=Lodderomyces beijingensis TaxID=1775926 RepID=A0ABP0ZW82_9ASCO
MINLKQVKKEIASCKNTQELNALLHAYSHHDVFNPSSSSSSSSTANLKPSYIKKKESEELNQVQAWIQSKRNELSHVQFEFQGEPQPPQFSTPTSTITVAPSFESNGVSVVDTRRELRGDHVHVARFRGSVMHLACKSANLSHGERCIVRVNCSGPVLVQNVARCILVLSCHQARLHHVCDCVVVVLSGKGGIIVENCKRLKVNAGVKVEDFNHPSRDPGFHILSEVEVGVVVALEDVTGVDALCR